VICIEGKELVDVTSRPMDTVLFSLYATYYSFSIAYPVDHKDLFLFIDSIIVGIQQNASSRISLQKFVKALKKLL
jgi:hypothetical protein